MLFNDKKLHPEDVHLQISRIWEWKAGFPIMRLGDGIELACPACGSSSRDNFVIHRTWRFFRKQNQSATVFRCDVSFKCQFCSYVWPHGVVVPFEEWRPERDGSSFTRDVVTQMLEAAGYGKEEDFDKRVEQEVQRRLADMAQARAEALKTGEELQDLGGAQGTQ
jgi:predicted secreted acid phosphatase